MKMMTEATLKRVLEAAYQAGYDQKNFELTGSVVSDEIKVGTVTEDERRLKVDLLVLEASK